MIELKDLQACAMAKGVPLAWYCYALVEPKAWPLGYIFWKQARWQEVRADMGISEIDMPMLPGELFGDAFLEKCARAVRIHLGFSP